MDEVHRGRQMNNTNRDRVTRGGGTELVAPAEGLVTDRLVSPCEATSMTGIKFIQQHWQKDPQMGSTSHTHTAPCWKSCRSAPFRRLWSEFKRTRIRKLLKESGYNLSKYNWQQSICSFVEQSAEKNANYYLLVLYFSKVVHLNCQNYFWKSSKYWEVKVVY